MLDTKIILDNIIYERGDHISSIIGVKLQIVKIQQSPLKLLEKINVTEL